MVIKIIGPPSMSVSIARKKNFSWSLFSSFIMSIAWQKLLAMFFDDSAWAKPSKLFSFFGLWVEFGFIKSKLRFSVGFSFGDCKGHSRCFQDFFSGLAFVNFYMCLELLFYCSIQWPPCWSCRTEALTFCFRISVYLMKFTIFSIWCNSQYLRMKTAP